MIYILSIIVSALLASSLPITNANFAQRDFVPMSYRGQLSRENTEWTDALGHFCPKFGVHQTSIVMLESEKKDKIADYRVQLSFDGGRLVTPWLQLKGRRAPLNPYIHVTLTRSGDALIGATAQVKGMQGGDLKFKNLVGQFNDMSVWPKHVMVKYSWSSRHETDLDTALTVLLSLGSLMTVFMGVRAISGYKKHLKKFFRDVSGEQSVSSARPPSMAKAD
eukprot:jgi/Picsp_1/3223/NSC_06063-R1_protein